jgi:hypothetical protein
MGKNCTDRSLFYSEIPKKVGTQFTNPLNIIAILIFSKFTRDLTVVRHLVHCSR